MTGGSIRWRRVNDTLSDSLPARKPEYASRYRLARVASAPHSSHVLRVSSGTVRSLDGFVMYNGRLGMEMLELFIPVKALDDWMLQQQLVREAVNYR
jgi:hypothetical protein